jgi:hypothetical protein
MDDVAKLAQQVIDALRPLAQKIGEGADVVYHLAVKDAFITGVEDWMYVAFGVLLLLQPIWVFKLTAPRTKKTSLRDGARADDASAYTSKAELSESQFAVRAMSMSLGLLLGLCLVGFDIGPALHYTLNPEYMALKDLLVTIKR